MMENVKILAIDDNEDNIVVMKALMGEAFPEATFISALSGKKGIALSISEKPDIVLLDIVMPEMDGYEVCQILKANEATKTIPVVMVTAARTDKESRIKALEMGADAFLAKPVDESELTAQVRAMLRIKEAEDRKLDEKERLSKLVDERTEALQKELKERKLAEKALKESEERFQMLFNKAPLGYQSLDFDGRFIEVNQQWLETLGYSREEVIGKWFGDFLSPEYQDGFRKRFPIFKSRGQIHSEFEMVHKNGNKRFIAFEGKIGYDLDGEFKQTHCILQDITENKHAEKALRDSEEKYRRMVDLLPDAVVIHTNGEIVFANAAALKMAGADSFEQLVERPLMHYVHPDFRAASLNRIKEIYTTGQPSKFSEEKFYTLNDEVLEVEVLGIPITFMGKPAIQTIIRDITDRKQAEEALKNSLSLTEATLESIHNGILVVNHQGKVVKTSQQFAEMWRIPQDILTTGDDTKLMESILDQLIDPDSFVAKVMDLYHNPEAESSDLINFKDGRIFERISKPMFIGGKPEGRIWSFLDITERMKAIESLRLNEEAYKRVINNVDEIIYSVSFNGNLMGGQVDFVSSQSKVILGYEAEEFIQNSGLWFELIHPEDSEMIASQTALNFKNRNFKTRIYRMKHKHTGKYIWIEDHPQFLFDENGNITGQFGTARDISERKLAEEQLKNSEERFRSIFENSTIGIYRTSPEGEILLANPTLVKMLGYESFEELKKRDLEKDYYEPDYQRSNFREKIESQGEIIGLETGWRRIDDSPVYVRESAKVIYDSDGRIMYYEGIVEDITKRKLAEESLRQSDEFNKSLLQTIPFGMDIVDEHGNVLFQSENFENVFGKKAIGSKCWELYRDDKQACNDCPLCNGITLGETEVYLTGGVLGGRIFEISHTGMMFNGKKAMLEIFQDVTERRQTELALEESENRYRSFISQVSEGVYRFECDQPMDLSLPVEEQIDFIYDHMFIAESNDAFRKMYGIVDEKEIIGMTNLDFHGGRDNQLNRDALRSFIADGYRTENALTEEINHDGQIRYLSKNALGIIENNQLVRMWGTQTDITEKTKSEKVQHVLYAISNAALSSISLTELVEFISTEVGKLLDSTNFYIAFYDEATGMLSANFNKDEKDQIEYWPAEKSATGYVIKHKISLLANEDEVMKLCEEGEILMIGTPSKIWLGVPLLLDDKAIGAIVVQSYNNPDAYTEKDKLMLEFISYQITISIQRKKAEAEIREKEVQYRNLADSGQALIWMSGTDKLCNYFNEPWLKFTGRTLEQETGNGWTEGVHPDDFDNCLQTYVTAFDKRLSFEMEYRLRHVSGEYRWIQDMGKPNYNSEGEFIGYIGHCFDINDRKKMEMELIDAKVKAEESEQQIALTNEELTGRNTFIQTILDNLPIGIALNNIDEGMATYMNKRFKEIYGWSNDEITSISTFFEHVYPDADYRNKLIAQIMTDIQTGDASKMHWENILVTRKDGSQRVVNAVNIPLIEQNTMVSTVSDITELNKTQRDLLAAKEKAEESDRLKSAFLANMSHEIRTPLNSIIGFSDLLCDPEFGADQHEDFARMISSSGNNLLTIINDIMDISKIEAGQIHLSKNVFSGQKLIRDIQKEYSFKAGEKGIELRLDPLNPDEEFIIESDEDRLRQVLTNFVGNALKFTEKGYIEIGIRQAGDFIRFHVKDTGIGVPEEYLNKIFERFRQVESENTRKYGGNGLGLAISKSLVEMLGGEIWMESEKGKGATFYFLIPRK